METSKLSDRQLDVYNHIVETFIWPSGKLARKLAYEIDGNYSKKEIQLIKATCVEILDGRNVEEATNDLFDKLFITPQQVLLEILSAGGK